jgi:hypothetical protein
MRENSAILSELNIIATKRGHETPRYDIRNLSREILLRANRNEYTWSDSNDTRLTLTTNNYGRYESYDLYAQEINDNDVHLYTYGTISNSLQYKYPLFTHHQIENSDDVRNDIERLLLSGPVHDKVADNQTENRIQKIFLAIARSLTIDSLNESNPDLKTDSYHRYLLAATDTARFAIIHELFEKVSGPEHLHVGVEQFNLAIHTDITRFKMQQKALTQSPPKPYSN